MVPDTKKKFFFNIIKKKNKNLLKKYQLKIKKKFINPLTSPGVGVSVFTYPYLNAVAPCTMRSKTVNKCSNK